MSKLFILYFLHLLLFSHTRKKDTNRNKSIPSDPKIVWIVVEDLSPEYLKSYGGIGGKTRNLNSLAAESLQYQNDFSTGRCLRSQSGGFDHGSISDFHRGDTHAKAGAICCSWRCLSSWIQRLFSSSRFVISKFDPKINNLWYLFSHFKFIWT